MLLVSRLHTASSFFRCRKTMPIGLNGLLLVGCVAVSCGVIYYLWSSDKKEKSASPAKSAESVLEPARYKPFVMTKKTQISPNTFKFRFALPNQTDALGLPVGRHILLKYEEGGESVSRPYTPVSTTRDRGFFELVIKTYPKGKMSQYLAHLDEGKSVDVRGPLGNLTYLGEGKFNVRRRNPETKANEEAVVTTKKVGMIAGGTGITPMLQVAREIMQNTKDRTEIFLIFANVTEEDILLREELETYKKEFTNFKVFYVLEKPPADWTGGTGFISADMIARHIPGASEDVFVLLCGPPPMMGAMTKHLTALQYKEQQYFTF